MSILYKIILDIKTGILSKAGEFISPLGKKPLFLSDKLVWSKVGKILLESLKKANLSDKFEQFKGECCRQEIERVIALVKKEEIDVIVGCGGGKALDTAKAASFYLDLPVITAPTSAATCSAWSSIAPLYTKEGVYLESLNLQKSPNLALVDPQVIAQAPARLISAGMGDALAKWCEGKVSTQGIKKGLSTEVALDLSKKSYHLIKSIGAKAKRDVEKKKCSSELDQIIQTNILLTGLIGALGKGRCRSSAAHAFNYGMSIFKETHGSLHGERVAFGIIMMLILENCSEKEIDKLLRFYSSLDLPLTLEKLGLIENEKTLTRLAKEICKEGSHIYRLPFPVNEKMVYGALLEANAWGKEIEKGKIEQILPKAPLDNSG